jgi:molybdopterin molybdotransferase
MLSFEDAFRRMLSLVLPLAAERVALDDACGRVLAEEVVSPVDLPPFDYSAMDGYAVRTRDFSGIGPWRLPVLGESRTGAAPAPLTAGHATRIFTGAELPAGADAVVMQENVVPDDGGATFRARPEALAHVRRRGEDLAMGSVALAPGTRLAPSHVGLAAAVDRAWLRVARRPVVTILGTGDELRPPGSVSRPGMIPDSNGVVLRAMAKAAGAVVRVAPTAPDDPSLTERAVRDALVGTDLLVTVGGVSVGAHDLVRPALEKAGVALEFWKVAIKPGKPLAVGRRGDALVLGLPGNPASAMVTFALFGLPVLRAMQGDPTPMPPSEPAILARAVRREPGRTEFLRAMVVRHDGRLLATPLANQASGAVTSMAQANALVMIAEERGALAEGDSVGVLWLRELGA